MSNGTVIYLNEASDSFVVQYCADTKTYMRNEWVPLYSGTDPLQSIGIKATAQILGTSAMGIAAIMAKENDSYWHGPYPWNGPIVELGKDYVLAITSGKLHRGYASSQGYWEGEFTAVNKTVTASDNSKLAHPILIDLGRANFQMFTAIRLLREYKSNKNYSSDPLGLSRYFSDYQQLAQDIAGDKYHLAAKFYGLIIKEAQDYFKQWCPNYWAGLPAEYQDALCATYSVMGKKKIEQIRIEDYNKKNLPYEPQPGYADAAGISHLSNSQMLGQLLGVTGYGDGVHGVSSSQLAAIAHQNTPEGLAARYALCHLKQTVGDNGSVARNDPALKQYDPAKGALSDSFLNDRANFLQAKLFDLLGNSKIKNYTTVDIPNASDNWQYTDLASKYTLNAIVAGSTAPSYLYHKAIFGADGKTLQGGTQDDHLYAGAGNETLNGGAGNDSYYIEANQTNVKDTIIDSDGIGSIWVGNKLLTAPSATIQFTGPDPRSANPLQVLVWTSKADGTTYKFKPLAPGSLTGTLTVSGGKLGAGEQIVIEHFDVKQAESPTGYLGIHLANTARTAASTSPYMPATPPAKTHKKTGTAQLVTVYALNGQKVQLTCTGQTLCETGADTFDFAKGSVTLTIPPGRDSVTFTLIDTSGSSKPDTVNLGAKVTDASGNIITSNNLAVTFDQAGLGTGTATKPDYSITGDFKPKEWKSEVVASTSIDPTWRVLTKAVGKTTTDPATGNVVVQTYLYTYNKVDRAGNFIPDTGQPDKNRDDTFLGTAGNDRISTGGGNNYVDARRGGNNTINAGNDTIFGGTGSDLINVGSGANLIAGGGGQDIIVAGNGNNRIYADAQVDLATALNGQKTAVATHLKGDFISVRDGNNTIVGSNGNDAIFVGTGNNTIVCGAGSTTVIGGVETAWASRSWGVLHEAFFNVGVASAPFIKPADYIGSTFDGVAVGVGDATIFGGAGDSHYWLSNGNNWLDAGGGNDLISAGSGNSTIYGGKGNDTIWGGGGNNYINLETGNDLVYLRGGNNTVIGGSGDDKIYSGDQAGWAISRTAGHNYIYGGSGNTTIFGSGGNDTLISGSLNGTGKSTRIHAGDGNEYIVGGGGGDTLLGGAGHDTIYAGEGDNKIVLSSNANENSTVYGGNGNDSIWGGAGTDVIYAGDGGTTANVTVVVAGTGTSSIYGGAGVDKLYGGSGNDTLVAGTGISTLQGGSGTEVMYGSIGNATLIAGTGSDTLYGGSGTDLLQGSSGNTLFVAGSGDETIRGGTGSNTYEFDAGSGNIEVQNTQYSDTLKFGTGIRAADLTLSATFGSDGQPALLVQIKGGGQITLDGGLSAGNRKFAFADGSTLSLTGLSAQAQWAAPQQVDVAKVENQYLAHARENVIQGLQQGGYNDQGGGNWYKPNAVRGTLWAKLYHSQTDYWYITPDYKKEYYSAGPQVEWWRFNRYSDALSVDDYSATLQQGAVTANDAVINVAGSSSSTYAGQVGIAVKWDMDPYKQRVGDMPYATGGYLYQDNTIGLTYKPGATSITMGVHWWAIKQSATGTPVSSSILPDPHSYNGWKHPGPLPATVSAYYTHRQTTYNLQQVNVGAGDHTVYAGRQTVVNSGTGNNVIYGGGFVNAGSGNDTIYGADVVYGGSGNETIDGAATVFEGSGNDSISGAYVVYGGAGNDTIRSSSTVYAGSGNDLLVQDWTVVAGTGNDTIFSSAGADIAINHNTVGNDLIGNTWFNPYDQTIDNYPHDSSQDVKVTFDPGITSSDLKFTWGQATTSFTGSSMEQPLTYKTINVSWGTGKIIQVISQSKLQFADGSYCTYEIDGHGGGIMNVYNAAGKLIKDFWQQSRTGLSGSDNYGAQAAQTSTFQAAMGAQTLSAIQFGAGITPASIKVAQSAQGDFVVSSNNGASTLTIPAQAITSSPATATFADGTRWQFVNAHGTPYTYLAGSGTVYLQNPSTVQFGAGITGNMITLGVGSLMLRVGNNTADTLHIEGFNPKDALNSTTVKNFKFADGTTLTYAQMLARGFDIYGTTGNEILTGTNLDNRIHAGTGNDALIGGGAHDTLYGGAGNDFIAGGRGNDTTTTGATHNVIAYNTGDGRDTIMATPGAANTLSLGGAVSYRDMSFAKSGNDLVFNEGANSTITLKGWYADAANRDIATLQVFAGAGHGGDPTLAAKLGNHKVEEFDFAKLAAQFDQARAANPALSRWNVMDGLLTAHLSGSDTAALGGDLAYYYGTQGSLSGMNLAAAQTTLQNPQFGTAQQNLSPWPTLNTGAAQIK